MFQTPHKLILLNYTWWLKWCKSKHLTCKHTSDCTNSAARDRGYSDWDPDNFSERYWPRAPSTPSAIQRSCTGRDILISFAPRHLWRSPNGTNMNKNESATNTKTILLPPTMIISVNNGDTSMPRVIYMMTFLTISRYFGGSRCRSNERNSVLVNIRCQYIVRTGPNKTTSQYIFYRNSPTSLFFPAISPIVSQR